MILLKNKKTGAEYYVDEKEYEALKKNNLLSRFNILSKKVEKKADATVEVLKFVKEHKPIKEQPQEEQSKIDQRQNLEQEITDAPITKPHERKRPYTKHQNQQ